MKNSVSGSLTAVRMKAENLYVAIDDARPATQIDTLADPAEGQRERPGMKIHDTVICAARVWGQQDGHEELDISNLAPISPAGFGASGGGAARD